MSVPQSATRSLSRIAAENYDVVVIGGGIMGCGIAWDSALRGLKTLLLEREDFGAKTSTGCFRIVHGGLRYLQHLDFARVCQSAREQQILRCIAPHLVKPLPFLIPCYGYGMKGKEVLRAALTVYEALTFWRNNGVPASHRLPNHRVLDVAETLRMAPGLNPEGLKGGIIYYDCQLQHCERFTAEVAFAAQAAGAEILNYAEASDFEHAGSAIKAVTIEDKLTGERVSARGRLFVNAAGPWLYKVLDTIGAQPPQASTMPFSVGVQVMIPKIMECAVAVESRELDDAAVIARGGRSFFMHPWRGYTLVGTSERLFIGDPDRFEITEDEIRGFVADVASAYRSPEITPENVLFAFGGVRAIDPKERPIYRKRQNAPARAPLVRRHDEIIDHSRHSALQASNLVTVEGVKYTTFRYVAEKAVDIVCRRLGVKRRSLTAETALPGGQGEVGGSELIGRLARDYGSRAHAVAESSVDNPALLEPLVPGSSVIGAQIVYAVRAEHARRLADAVFRRTDLGLLGYPGDEALARAAHLMGRELEWSESFVKSEIASVRNQFAALPSRSSRQPA